MIAWSSSYQISELLPILEGTATFFNPVARIYEAVGVEWDNFSVRYHGLVAFRPIDSRETANVSIGEYIICVAS